MKLSLKIICIVLCLSFILGSAISAVADTEGLYAYVKTNRAALYSNSKMTSRSRYLYKFELVTVLGSDNTKAKVQYGSKTGYIYTKYLTKVNSIDETAYTNRDTKIYLQPKTSANSKAVNRNSKVTVLMYNGSWAMIEIDGILAYIQKAFLSDSIDSSWTPIAVQDRTSYELNGDVVECDFDAKVNVSSLSIYSKASTSSTKLGILKRNTVVNVCAYNSTWAYIEFNGKYGYCKWSYLKKIQEETVTPAPTQSVQDEEALTSVTPFDAKANDKIRIYDACSTQSKYLGYIEKNTVVQVLAYNDTWAQISLGGKTGYTLKSGLDIVPQSESLLPTPTPAPTPTPSPTPAPTPVYASTDEIFLNASTTNEQKIYEYLTSRTDYNEAVACGILANIKQESNFSPTSGQGKNYQGLCQWSTSRFAILQNWCEKNGYNPYSLEGQIKFLWYDLSQRYTVYHKNLLEIPNTAQGAYDAGYYFCYYYERPSSLESSSVKRGTKAKDVYWVKYAH